MKKIWMNKTNSFKAAERFDRNYYLAMPGSIKIEIMQFLREEYFKIKGLRNENREGLRRVIKVIKQE